MSLNLYVKIVVLAGIASLLYTLPGLPSDQLGALLILAVLCALAQRMPVSLFAKSSVSLAVAFAFTGLLLLGPGGAIVINLTAILVHAVYPKRRPLHKVAFNLAVAALCAWVGGLVYAAAGGQFPPQDYLSSLIPMGLAVLCYFLIQSGAVTAAIVLSDGGSFAKTWDANYRWLLLNYIAIGPISLGMAQGYARSSTLSGPTAQLAGLLEMISFGLPLVMIWYSVHLYMSKSKEVIARNRLLEASNQKLEESFLNTIRALAATVDTKDHYTHDHSQEAMRYAADTAQRMGLDPLSVAAAEVAALFHDIGKIGIPESILHKVGALNEEEWSIMRQHPVLGANVVRQVSALSDVVPAVLHHHERFDGQGYPDQLSGTDIPLTAQIVAVVDAYQAMTSARPYRPPLSHEYAVGELRKHAGTQFNPAVVEAFIAARESAMHGDTVAQVDLSLLLRLDPSKAMAPA